tara:strand:- start:294 stop:1214 length:921 start_codon:yes stop_codon:yes gene_type:complete
MAIQNDKKGTLGQTIQITVASTTDQTQKVRVEVPSGTSVMDAVRKAGIADGQVDVFDSMGQVVTRDRADTLSDQTVYVGPKRVAGGNDNWELEDIDLDDLVNQGTKPITFASVLNEEIRAEIVPENGETLRQCGQRSGLAPRDGSGWAVYDDMGFEVSDQVAKDSGVNTVWIGPKAIDAGRMGGLYLTRKQIQRLRVDYPSIQVIRHVNNSGTKVQMFMVQIPDGKNRISENSYRCVIDLRFPTTHVLNPPSQGHPHIYSTSTLPGTSVSTLTVCQGSVGSVWAGINDPLEKVGAYLNHIYSVVNS